MAEEGMQGLADLLAQLKDLPRNMEMNALRTGVFKAAQDMRDKVSAAAPVSNGNPPRGGRFASMSPGHLKASIKAKRRRGEKGVVSSGVYGAWYAKLVEKGHALKSHGPNAHVVGHVPGSHFIENTARANEKGVMDALAKGLADAIGKQFAKLKKLAG